MIHAELRWEDYLLVSGDDFAGLWGRILAEPARRILFVLGGGFDPRMCDALAAILALPRNAELLPLVVEYRDTNAPAPPEALAELARENRTRLEELCASSGAELKRLEVPTLSTEGRRVGDRRIAQAFGDLDLANYTDVAVDVSALPRPLYFPLLAGLLSRADRASGAVDQDRAHPLNIHVVVAHSPGLDEAIVDTGIDEDAVFLHGFAAAAFELEATREQPRVWIPLLGSAKLAQLERTNELATPDEICPLLPSPARNPRASDDLVLEYREILFDRWGVEPRNFIYASEENPFEVYRAIMRATDRYRSALAALGGCKVVLSPLSSKLSSIGALLAAYDLGTRAGTERVDVAVAHVESAGYELQCEPGEMPRRLFGLWLAGECYET